MKLLDRIRPKYQLRASVRGLNGQWGHPVNLYPTDTMTLTDAETGRPWLNVKFLGAAGIEVTQLAPVIPVEPGLLRSWADFVEKETADLRWGIKA